MASLEYPRDLVGIERVELLRRLIRSGGSSVVFAEIGVWKGELAEQLLEEPTVEQYHLIDPWQQLPEWNKPFNVDGKEFSAVRSEAMRRTEKHSQKRIVHQGTTIDACKTIADSSLDIAYIDGDHTLRGVLIDLVAIYSKVRNGGFLIGDDAVPNPWQHGPDYEPSLVYPVCRHLAEVWACPIYMASQCQFIIHKLPGAGFRFCDATGLYSIQALLPFVRPRTTV